MIGFLFLSAAIAHFYSLPFAAILQGAGYRTRVYFKRCGKFCVFSLLYFVVLAPVVVWIEGFFALRFRWVFFLCALLSTALVLFVVSKKIGIEGKFTHRLIRLSIGHIVCYLLFLFALAFTPLRVLWCVAPSLSPFVFAIASLVLQPFERKNNARYVARAKGKLEKMKAVKIGVTGSYGKTSVKVLLNRFLSLSFNVLSTPENYNTPLGIAKSLQNASGEEDFFIAEMGARRKGDIAELCALVSPDLGIVTGIAPQHLETFGSVENIMAEKGELPASVPENGFVFYNVADDRVRSLSEKRVGGKKTVGFENADYLIENYRCSADGISFDLVQEGERLPLVSPLLGRGAAVDLALAAAVAVELGVKKEKLIEEAKRMRPAPHRLEAIKRGDVLILDDGYNANPIGVCTALETLRTIEGKRKIVYTSGIVELGKEEVSINVRIGEEIAKVADVAIVCAGKFGDLVTRGLHSSDFPEEKIFRVKDTEEATALFGRVLQAGDVLLITSDLPRDYRL